MNDNLMSALRFDVLLYFLLFFQHSLFVFFLCCDLKASFTNSILILIIEQQDFLLRKVSIIFTIGLMTLPGILLEESLVEPFILVRKTGCV